MALRLFVGAVAAVSLLVSLPACQDNRPSPNLGRTTTADPAKRRSNEVDLASKDLVSSTDDIVQQIASKPEFRNPPYRINIVMDRVVNKTSLPSRNFDIYLARIRSQLNQSGARYNIGFVERKATVEAIRQSEGLEPPPGSAGSYKSKADYALKGDFYDMPNVGSNYYLLTFQIVDLHDGEIVFEGNYEAKFGS